MESSPHRFSFAAEWGQELTAAHPPFTRKSGPIAPVPIRENDDIVAAGRYQTPDGQSCELPLAPPSERFEVPVEAVPLDTMKFTATEVCVANIDTVSAALALGDATALNFANAYSAGGGYRAGASAQEEQLCRLLPQMIHSLEACKYPIQPEETILTKDLLAVRSPGYRLCHSRGPLHILTAAMPCGDAGQPGCDTWNQTVRLRMRSVLHAAKMSGFPNLVLGAWGCGAFGNPPRMVAALFREQLASPEFRGAFEKIIFAVVDPDGDGNFKPFLKEIARIHDSVDDAGTAKAEQPAAKKAKAAATAC